MAFTGGPVKNVNDKADTEWDNYIKYTYRKNNRPLHYVILISSFAANPPQIHIHQDAS